MPEIKIQYETYLDENKNIRIRPVGSKNKGKVYEGPKNVAYFVITQIAQGGLDEKCLILSEEVKQIPKFKETYDSILQNYLANHPRY